jgi:hypothetical protein
MKPTEQQINQAKKLSKFDLCQDAELSIFGKNGEYLFADRGSKFARNSDEELPLPTFEEVWVELLIMIEESLQPIEFSLNDLGAFIFDREEPESAIHRFYWVDGFTPTTAAIEALLLLKEN